VTGVRGRHAVPVLAVGLSFAAGIFVDGWLRTYRPPPIAQSEPARSAPPVEPVVPVVPRIPVAPPPADPLVGPGVELKATEVPAMAADAVPATKRRVPIDGVSVESFNGGFAEHRGARPHEAVDIVVARGTPIHAVQDGTIAKLFLSKPGGITIYQFDVEGRICYYYAHLDRYADGLHDGQHVSQGEVIGYVGTSGNAPPDTPHLHFAVFELDADKKWWHGRPLDPYLVFKPSAQ
jgi:murein DD-endopeptidase MepM/ murein hydrolase activator NlpD